MLWWLILNRKKLLLENFFVYGLGGVISRIIPFIMLPIITYLFPDETYFGINDLFSTLTSLCCVVGVFGMWDTAFRFFFDKEDKDYRRNICSTSLAISIVVSMISVVILFIFGQWIAEKIYGSDAYFFLIWFNILGIITGNIGTMLSAPTRMLNQRKIFLIVNSLTPVITYTIAILLILKGWYLSALPLASVLSSTVTMLIFWSLNKEWFSFKRIRVDLALPLIKFGIPIMPQQIMYFVINSSDKLMIAAMLGQSLNGLYAVGGKFGHISQLIYTAFAGGWVYYRYATMDAEDQVENITRIFEFLAIISFASFGIACVFAKWVIRVLFQEIYYDSFIVIPYLFLAPLVQMLFQTVAGQFTLIKKTWPNLIFLAIGAVVNVILNYFLIPLMGIEGASIATLIGYIVSAVIAVFACIKIKMLNPSIRFYTSVFVVAFFYIIWRSHLDSFAIPLIAAILMICCFWIMYKNEILRLIKFDGNMKIWGKKTDK